MHKILFCLLLLPVFSLSQEKPVPEELKPFIKTGYEVLDWATEDLNGDKRKDYVLILKKQGEDTAGVESDTWAIPRPFLLLTRGTNNKLKIAAENKELILCRHCGGMMGDPYLELKLTPGRFRVDFYGGSGDRWAVDVHFRYDQVKKDWFFEKEHIVTFSVAEPDKETESTLKRNETGDISIREYIQEHNRDSSYWLVKQKTYFYDSPELNSSPRKAYLVKGDRVQSWAVYKNFINCIFENNKGEFTLGYILKKDLQRLPAQKPKAIQ